MKKILIVDDEKAVCSLLEKFLGRKGYKVSSALSGQKAIEEVQKSRPDLILLDIKMPGLDGIETLKRIKNIDKETIVIMITAVNDDETGKKCMGLGAFDYVTKPLGLDYLEKCLLAKLPT